MAPVIYALLGASFTLATAWALGAVILRKLASSLGRLEQSLLGIIAGSACLSAVVFALCSVGMARKAVYLSVGLLAGIFAFRWGTLGASADKPIQPLHRVLRTLFVVTFSALTVLDLVSAMTPEIYPGDTTQHLSQVDRAHGFYPGATFPEAAELLLLPAFAFGRHAGVEVFRLGILATLSLLVLYYGRRVGSPVAGVAAGLLTYAGPVFGRYYSIANIDVIGAAAVFALFYLIRLWTRQHALPLSVSIGILTGYCLIAKQTAIAPNLSSLLPEQYRWVSLALLTLCLVPLFLALALPAGRPVLAAASILASLYVVTGGTQGLVIGAPLIALAWCMGCGNLAVVGTWTHSAASAAQTVTSCAIPARLVRMAGAAIIVAYFVFFAWDGLHARFSVDDPANIFGYWQRGAWPLIRAQFEFFSTYYRPMGGLFYLPIYDLAGFNPLPYRVVGLSIVLLNIAVFYRVAKLVSGSERVAWVAAILLSYHPKLADIVYQNAVIYDLLCFLFYFAALAWYLGIRARGQFCNWRQTAVFIVLYICALNSKEMAVTLPLILGLYELLFHPPEAISLQKMRTWLAREGRVCLIAVVLTAIYVLGKTLGPDPLMAVPAYTPEFTLQKFMTSITANIQTLFHLPDWFGPGLVAGSFAGILVLAWIRRSRYVAFCALFAILSELPIAFVGRSGSNLYIPLAAWAMLVSAAVWKAAELVASAFRTRAIAGLLVASFLFFNARLARSQTVHVRSYFHDLYVPVWAVIQQISKVDVKPPPRAKIAFENDPLPPFTTLYLAYFHFQDLSLHIRLSQTALPQAELSGVDYVFDYRDGQFALVKP
ncbi:MAG TPA: hypothetical protein VEU96_32600 [Bryobacteraceae bacterium]|nr:hypothetical protein [Bryobacteraceae bacterium]